MKSDRDDINEEKAHNRTIEFNENFSLDPCQPNNETNEDSGSNIHNLFKSNIFSLGPLEHTKKPLSKR